MPRKPPSPREPTTRHRACAAVCARARAGCPYFTRYSISTRGYFSRHSAVASEFGPGLVLHVVSFAACRTAGMKVAHRNRPQARTGQSRLLEGERHGFTGVGRTIDTDDDQVRIDGRHLLPACHRYRTPRMRGQSDTQRRDHEQLFHHVQRLRPHHQQGRLRSLLNQHAGARTISSTRIDLKIRMPLANEVRCLAQHHLTARAEMSAPGALGVRHMRMGFCPRGPFKGMHQAQRQTPQYRFLRSPGNTGPACLRRADADDDRLETMGTGYGNGGHRGTRIQLAAPACRSRPASSPRTRMTRADGYTPWGRRSRGTDIASRPRCDRLGP